MINKIYKSVLITGASSGIGLETLKRFLKENVKVYALDKDVSILEKLKKKTQIWNHSNWSLWYRSNL